MNHLHHLHTIHQEFSRRLGHLGQVVIAGGAVRDTLLGRPPKDYDVFILGTELAAQRAAISEALADLVEAPGWHRSEPFLATSVYFTYPVDDGLAVDTALIQVLCTPEESLPALLDTFDWNICMFGYDGEKAHTGLGWEATRLRTHRLCHPGQPLHLNRITFPLSTLRRGFRFSERFQMKLEPGDIRRLCEAVLKGPPKEIP